VFRNDPNPIKERNTMEKATICNGHFRLPFDVEDGDTLSCAFEHVRDSFMLDSMSGYRVTVKREGRTFEASWDDPIRGGDEVDIAKRAEQKA